MRQTFGIHYGGHIYSVICDENASDTEIRYAATKDSSILCHRPWQNPRDYVNACYTGKIVKYEKFD